MLCFLYVDLYNFKYIKLFDYYQKIYGLNRREITSFTLFSLFIGQEIKTQKKKKKVMFLWPNSDEASINIRVFLDF